MTSKRCKEGAMVMNEDLGTPGRVSRPEPWVILITAMAGSAAIYFLSTEQGRKWLRELPEVGRQYAATTRQAIVTLRDVAEQVEHAVATFEQALGNVSETLAARDTTAAGSSRNGGEHALAD
jgi:hypothetical protein